jgi:DNA-binding transcriptional LysR family regulator
MHWIMPQLGDLEGEEPERGMNLFFGRTEDLFRHMRRGTVDCVVAGGRVVAPESATSELLVPERYVFVGAANLVSLRPLMSCNGAMQHVLLDLEEDCSTFEHFLRACPSDERWSFIEHRRMTSISTLRSAILGGRGVGVLPRLCVEDALQSGKLVELMPERRPRTDWVRMYWSKGHPRSAQLSELAKSLRPQNPH